MPSLLSTSATDCFGRHESHIRYLPLSRSTETSKQVPYFPPITGLPSNFFQPPDVSRAAGGGTTTDEVGGGCKFVLSANRPKATGLSITTSFAQSAHAPL